MSVSITIDSFLLLRRELVWSTPIGRVSLYHLAMLLAMLGGSALYCLEMRRLRIPWKELLISLPLAVVLPVTGARLLDVAAYDPNLFRKLHRVFDVFSGGLSSHGAIIGLIILVPLLARLYQRPAGAVADRLTIWALLGLAVTRGADHLLGQGIGTPSDLAWASTLYGLIPRHPTHIYEILLLAALALLFIIFGPRLRVKKPGAAAGLTMLCYFICRLPLDGLREVESLSFMPSVKTGQALSAPLILFFAVYTIWSLRRNSPLGEAWREDASSPDVPMTPPRGGLKGSLVLLVASAIMGALAHQLATILVLFGAPLEFWLEANLLHYALLWAVPLALLTSLGSTLGSNLEGRKSNNVISRVLWSMSVILAVILMLLSRSASAALAVVTLSIALLVFHRIYHLVIFIVAGAGALLVIQLARPLLPDLFPPYASDSLRPLYFGTAAVLVDAIGRRVSAASDKSGRSLYSF